MAGLAKAPVRATSCQRPSQSVQWTLRMWPPSTRIVAPLT